MQETEKKPKKTVTAEQIHSNFHFSLLVNCESQRPCTLFVEKYVFSTCCLSSCRHYYYDDDIKLDVRDQELKVMARKYQRRNAISARSTSNEAQALRIISLQLVSHYHEDDDEEESQEEEFEINSTTPAAGATIATKNNRRTAKAFAPTVSPAA
jgi:hypothetical protein